MDQQQLQEKIAEYYSKLPNDAQQFFASMAWMDTLRGISTRYGLNSTQIEILGTETTLVLLGMIHPDEYEENITKDLNLSSDKLQKLLEEIDNSIFKSLRSQLIDTYEQHVESVMEANGIEVTDNTLDPRFSTLPVEVQNAIAVSDYQKKLYDIGSEYKLPVNKMAALEDITVRLITAKISPTQYEGELAIDTDLPAEKVSEIANKVNDQILKKIREVMQNEGSREVAEDEVPIPPYVESKKVELNIPINKKVDVPISNISKMESDIYSNAGIEIAEDSNIKDIPPTPPVNTNIDMFANKLNKVVVNKSVVSDHSLPKVGSSPIPTATPIAAQPKAPHDPYHEPIN